jgi:class 3 adenylate cyclase
MLGADAVDTLAALKAHRRGRIVKTTVDGSLVAFGSVVDAVQCAIEVNKAMATAPGMVYLSKAVAIRFATCSTSGWKIWASR